MTYLVERLAELRRHLDHLQELRPRISGSLELKRDMSLQNDVLFSLLMICQQVVDIAGELSARRGERFEDYTGAIRNLARDQRFPGDLINELERLPGFRNILVREYVVLDMERVVEALDRLESVERFVRIVSQIESAES
jgi:uncharacterized protein YutE (UPF0331/DUF86 family)